MSSASSQDADCFIAAADADCSGSEGGSVICDGMFTHDESDSAITDLALAGEGSMVDLPSVSTLIDVDG
eukprot:1889890-Amphidinium_carterae.1